MTNPQKKPDAGTNMFGDQIDSGNYGNNMNSNVDEDDDEDDIQQEIDKTPSFFSQRFAHDLLKGNDQNFNDENLNS